jgi:hypothetical protein
MKVNQKAYLYFTEIYILQQRHEDIYIYREREGRIFGL